MYFTLCYFNSLVVFWLVAVCLNVIFPYERALISCISVRIFTCSFHFRGNCTSTQHWACFVCHLNMLCDQAKMSQNYTVFKIQPNKADSFFCFLLFVQSFSCVYLSNQSPNLCGVFSKLKPKQYPDRKCKKKPNNNNNKILTSDSFCLIASHIINTVLKNKHPEASCLRNTKMTWKV